MSLSTESRAKRDQGKTSLLNAYILGDEDKNGERRLYLDPDQIVLNIPLLTYFFLNAC